MSTFAYNILYIIMLSNLNKKFGVGVCNVHCCDSAVFLVWCSSQAKRKFSKLLNILKFLQWMRYSRVIRGSSESAEYEGRQMKKCRKKLVIAVDSHLGSPPPPPPPFFLFVLPPSIFQFHPFYNLFPKQIYVSVIVKHKRLLVFFYIIMFAPFLPELRSYKRQKNERLHYTQSMFGFHFFTFLVKK
jgi:hypothetical protein